MEFLAHHTFVHTLSMGAGLVISILIGSMLVARIIFKESSK